ncbi:MAG TPA: serine/threonine-protein kinase PknK, partial [Polyangiaceae bacterium]|nr:serine/threonine-protein kinase PknK [Polyangiaceae bacterium]
LAALFLADGDAAAAEREARAAAGALAPVPPVALGARVVLARALLAQDRAVEALEVARTAAEAADNDGCVTEADPGVLLALAEALTASGDHAEGEMAARRGAALLAERADRIPDPAWRRRFLSGVPEHASLLQRCAIPIS